MDQETYWKVFALRSQELFRHHSVLFESSEGDSFCCELFVPEELQEVILKCRNIDLRNPNYRLSKTCLGIVTTSAENIVKTAITVLQDFGSYHSVLNNCQVSIQATVCYCLQLGVKVHVGSKKLYVLLCEKDHTCSTIL